jgi:hypothetical protein
MALNRECDEPYRLFLQTRDSFGESVLRAMRVADQEKNGDPRKITSMGSLNVHAWRVRR